MKLYPTIEEVFEEPTDFLKTVFFPLLTIDLAAMNKGEGKVHFLTVWGNGNPELDFKDDLFNYDNFCKHVLISALHINCSVHPVG